jgi:hypothetical protein
VVAPPCVAAADLVLLCSLARRCAPIWARHGDRAPVAEAKSAARRAPHPRRPLPLTLAARPPRRQQARGNQRDTDRERAAKRAAANGGGKSNDDGLTPLQRRERDAAAIKAKEERKAAEKAAMEANGGVAPPKPKVVQGKSGGKK